MKELKAKVIDTTPPITPGRARSFSSSQESCAVGLLDIDLTLSFDLRTKDAEKLGVKIDGINDAVINQTVLDDLRSKGIFDIFFFTKMRSFSFEDAAGSVPERSSLIKFFRQQGFRVHGVITAQDYTSHIPTEELKQYIEEYGLRLESAQKQQKEENKLLQAQGLPLIDNTESRFKKALFRSILEEKPEAFPNITRLFHVTRETPNEDRAFAQLKQLWIGDAFKRATTEKEENRKQLRNHSTYAQQVSDMLVEIDAYGKETKIFMFRQFMRQRPKYLVEIHVYDDLREELDAIENIKHEFPDAKIYTYNVTGLGPEKIVPVSKEPKTKHRSAEDRESPLQSSAASITLGFPKKPAAKTPPASPGPQPKQPEKKTGLKTFFSSRFGGTK